MVDAVAAEAARRDVPQLTAERVDAEDLAYPDASFDIAICVLGLMYPANPQRAIEQMFRVLKPGGRAAACVWGRRDRCGWREIFPIIDARVESDVCPMFFSLGSPGALDYAFERAGFTARREERDIAVAALARRARRLRRHAPRRPRRPPVLEDDARTAHRASRATSSRASPPIATPTAPTT